MPKKYPQQQRKDLLNALKYGKKNAIVAKDLAKLLGFATDGNQVNLRGLIKECIEIDGDLIGASTGKPKGFFKIETIDELEAYIDSLESRIKSDNQRRSALIKNWKIKNPKQNTNKIILTIL